MRSVVVIGTGGLAREFTAWSVGFFDIIAYSSNNPTEHSEFSLPGTFFDADITPETVGTDLAIIAIGAPAVKARLYEKLAMLGFQFPSFIHPTCVVSDLVDLGEGVIVSPNCVIGPNVSLGTLVYVNYACGIGHDATIGSFTQINPGAQFGGGAKIGEGVLVGSGSTILQKITVGDKASIGSGSVVFSRVDPGSTVMGNPARRMRVLEQQDCDT